MGKQVQPRLRFPEFKGDWKSSSLESYIDLISGFAFKGDDISENQNGTPLLRGINITEGYIRHSKDIDRYYNGNIDSLSKFLTLKNDLVLGMDGSKVGKNVALINNENVGSLLIQRVARIRANKKADIHFIFQNIFNSKFHNYVDKVNTSSGIPHISSKQINNFKIGFPSLQEQQKIATFLTSVDERITLLTQQKEKLEQYKKGVMQQLFSQELRFKQDDGKDFPNWEEKKFGEIGKIVTGKTPSTTDMSLWNGNIQFITPTDIKDGNKYQFNTDRTVVLKKGMYVLPEKSIIFTSIASIGKMCLSVKPCITNQQINSIVPSIEYDNEFIYYSILNIVPKIKSTQANTTLPIINKTDFSNFVINIPCKEEQQKIASFLSAIDTQIEHVNSLLENTNYFKKGLLQQMFV